MHNIYLKKLLLDNSVTQQGATIKVPIFLVSGKIIVNLSNQLKKKSRILLICCKIIMNLYDQLHTHTDKKEKKNTHFGNNV